MAGSGSSAMAGIGAMAAPQAVLKWKVPPGWKEIPSKEEMRFATFLVQDGNPPVELTVIPLGPEAGELLPNLVRWENQLGLPPSGPADVNRLIKQTTINGLNVNLIDLTSPPSAKEPKRMLSAIIPYANRVWFFKLIGPEPAVTGQKANFDAFMNSLTAGGQTGEAAQPGTMPTTAMSVPAGNVQIKSFKAPQGWQELAHQAPPRALAFDIGSGTDKIELVVTHFPQNDVGPFMANVNRWRQQVGLGPVDDPKSVSMKDVKVGQAPAMLFDFDNPAASPPKGMTVCLAAAGKEFWFFKMTGPLSAVQAQHDAFVKFLNSVEFNGEPATSNHAQ